MIKSSYDGLDQPWVERPQHAGYPDSQARNHRGANSGRHAVDDRRLEPPGDGALTTPVPLRALPEGQRPPTSGTNDDVSES